MEDSRQSDPIVIARMQSLIRRWEIDADHKATFLSCYALMTGNMITAVKANEFRDRDWVDRLLHRFADYYFVALDAYEHDPRTAPPVWQLAHTAAHRLDSSPMQNLLLGVNAHINYDLVLTLVDLLQPEWSGLSDEQRELRHADHRHVNDVIARTIDAVQDEVIAPAMPGMWLLDRLLGPLDEMLISNLITRWRESVWDNAMRLLAIDDAEQQAKVIAQVEEESLRTGEAIYTRDISSLIFR